MTNLNIKKAQNLVVGASAAVLVVTALTIVGELAPPLKDFLKATFSHHWIGKGAVGALVFVVVAAVDAIIPVEGNSDSLALDIYILAWVTLASFLAIYGFFIFETFAKP